MFEKILKENMEEDDMIRYQRDQDDEPMLSNEENGASGMLVDEYGQPVPSPNAAKQLTFEQ